MPKVINSEQAAMDNEEKLQKRAEARMAGLVEGLTTEDVDFDMTKDNTDPAEQEQEYKKDAWAGLKATLAAAGAEEAKAAARKFSK